MDLHFWHYIVIFALGVIASIINIMAGGGSNLILPVLMMFGVPPEIANGSNRVGVFLQAVTGIHGFARAAKMPNMSQLKPIILPTLFGGVIGALLASVLPSSILKPTLLFCMLFVAAWVALKPDVFTSKPTDEPKPVSPAVFCWLFAVGAYGGFVQAGVGLLMLPVFAGILGYDLARSNALKLTCTFGFTLLALIIFLWQGQIWWQVAIPLSLGNMLGAAIGVKVALKIQAQTLRWAVFVMTLVAVSLALFLG
ncbi:sulfite exporter TauE/SafE family protein [Neisseriaceae bacterium B1]